MRSSASPFHLFTRTRSIAPSSAHAIRPTNRFLRNNPYQVAAMSSNTRAPLNDADPSQSQTSQSLNQDTTQQKAPLALPEAPSSDGTHQIDLSDGTGTAKLDHLGPLVVNADGTLSRIGNWAQMTEIERNNTLKVLGRRNQVRLKALREQRGEGQSEGEGK